MKKATTTKTTPATPAPVPAKKTASAAKPKPAKTPKAPPASPAPAPAPAVKPAAAKGAVTTITAHIDIGFGNTLYIRGDGPGLSWEKGVVMDCVVDDKWSISLSGVSVPVVFKFLVNDLTWSAGDDYVVSPGGDLVVVPTF